MIDFDITIPGLEAELAKLRDWDKYVNKHFETAMKSSMITASNEIKKRTPVGASGFLRQSIGYRVETTGPGSVIGHVGSSKSEYAYYANYGRKPGKMPPIDALLLWVHRKQLAGTYAIEASAKGYHRRMGGRTTQAKQDRQVAFLIARSIGRHGTKATNFMEHGMEAAMPAILANFNKALGLIKQDLSGGPGAGAAAEVG
jgi:hypothetical protein